ncbi:transient receptor potential cation channel subfamily A member 1-like [Haliotis asinina]|uniref:transient receptor potential cation channel subfamily A member 1-like n=1 Tax=Haliotis asinina TaxID=109174 RepID=UPI003531FC4A
MKKTKVPLQRRSTSMALVPGEASEDGDFVTLRAYRDEKRKQKTNDIELPTIAEQTDKPKKVSQSDISVHEKAHLHREPTVANAHLRDELFAAVEEGSVEELKNKIINLPADLTITSASLRKPKTRENILHFAFENGKREIIEYFMNTFDPKLTAMLMGEDYEVFMPNLHGKKNILHKITEMKDIELARQVVKKMSIYNKDSLMQLLKQETPVQIAGQRPRTFPCLHLAAFYGYTDFVQFYHDCGMDANHINAKKDTALLWAARWGHEDTVRVLLKRGAKPNLENDKGSTALYWAIRYGYTGTVKLLAEEGSADVNQTRKLGLVAPIVLASALGHDEIVKILLRHGADVNHVIRGRERPIHHAAREGNTDVLLTLLNNGAAIDETDERGDTALILSARYGHGQILAHLIKHGADINHKNHNGEDVWHFAFDNDTSRILEILIQVLQNMGFLKPSEEDKDKLTFTKDVKSPILQAASLGLVDKINMLLGLNLDPTACDEEGNSLHHHAAMSNQFQVIKTFHSQYSIDAENARGQTALHLACKYGHHETIEVLIQLKAKAGVKNLRGETALHTAASSKSIRPDTVKMLLEHIIKTHTWESLNVRDDKGNNPLHTAAEFASQDVLWEFRFVRLKDKNERGNTPMHESVRPGEPEVLDTMLDIYETMKRDVDINEPNDVKETVLHRATMAGFDEGVKRLILFESDLSLQCKEGNTVLHCLTSAIVDNPTKVHMYLKVLDVIIDQAVRWWCIKNGHRFPDDSRDLYFHYKRQAVRYLTCGIYNKSDLNVLSLACRVGCVQVVERIVLMEHVMCFSLQKKTRYDITHITPRTNDSLSGMRGSGKVVPRPSCLEWLLSTESPERAARVLDIAPMKEIERVYSNVAAVTYLLIIVLHILYMTLFSISAVALGEKRRNTTSDNSIDVPTVIFYAVVPLEPALLLLYMIYSFIKVLCQGEFTMKYRLQKGSSDFVSLIIRYSSIVLSVVYSCLVFVWMGLYMGGYTYQDYILAPALLMGWFMSITYTRGFRPIHYFWRMIQNMIIRDVMKFIFIYLFVLLGFSFALHVLFQASSQVIASYPNPLHTMFLTFNLMLGMADLFDEAFETNMSLAGRHTVYAKIIFLVYMVLAAIVLLNLLIAMMNTSYSAILQKQTLSWRIESVQLGIDLEKAVPAASRLFAGGKLHRGHIVPDKKSPGDVKWFIEVHNSTQTTALIEDDPETEAVKELTERVKAMEVRVTEQMRQVQHTLDEIRHEILTRTSQ